MLCSACGRNPAKTYLKRTGDKELKLELCPACYQALYPERQSDDFFTSFLGNVGSGKKECSACGSTLEDYRRTGLLGCAYCYTAFRDEILPTISFIQGKVRHEGKEPSAGAAEKYDMVREIAYQQENLREKIRLAKEAGDEDEVRRLKQQLAKLNQKLSGGEGV